MIETRLDRLFSNGDDDYARFEKAALESTFARTYSLGELYEAVPFFNAIHRLKMGQPIAALGQNKDGALEYGFDKAGRLVSSTEFTRFPGVFIRTFYHYHHDCTEVITFRKTPDEVEVIKACCQYRKDGALHLVEAMTEYSVSQYRYHYQGNQVSRIEFSCTDSLSRQLSNFEYQFVYQGELLTSIDKTDLATGVSTLIQIAATPQLPQALLTSLEMQVFNTIVAVIARIKAINSKPLYCLYLLSSHAASQLSLPLLAIGVEHPDGSRPEDPNCLTYFDNKEVDISTPELNALFGSLREAGAASDALERCYDAVVARLKDTQADGLLTEDKTLISHRYLEDF